MQRHPGGCLCFYVRTMPAPIIKPHRRPVVVPGFDPRSHPLVALDPLPDLPSQALQLDFMRSAFGQPVQWQVEPLFRSSFHPDFLPGSVNIRAAVCIGVIQRPDGPSIIFTRRATHLHNHAGQISFPGGRIEPSDVGPVEAALRETQEEIGIEPRFVRYLGQHPIFVTSTQFAMRPIIGELQAGFTVVPDSAEVAEVFEVPLSVLLDPQRHQLHHAILPDGTQRQYFSIPWGPYFIWGATAVLVRNLYHHLSAAWNQLSAGGDARR